MTRTPIASSARERISSRSPATTCCRRKRTPSCRRRNSCQSAASASVARTRSARASAVFAPTAPRTHLAPSSTILRRMPGSSARVIETLRRASPLSFLPTVGGKERGRGEDRGPTTHLSLSREAAIWGRSAPRSGDGWGQQIALRARALKLQRRVEELGERRRFERVRRPDDVGDRALRDDRGLGHLGRELRGLGHVHRWRK